MKSLILACQFLLTQKGMDSYVVNAKLLSESGSSAVTETFKHRGKTWVIKRYRGGADLLYRQDAISLNWLKAHSLPEDSVQVVDFKNIGDGFQIHDYIEGESVLEFLDDPEVSLNDKKEVIEKFELYGKTLQKRLIRLFPGETLETNSLPSFALDLKIKTPLQVNWFKFILRERSMVIVPHTENVIVEKGTHKLWLIDPR